MLQWTDLHPYNAVHVVEIPGALDLDRLRLVIDGAIENLGLTNLTLDRERSAYAYEGGAARSEIKVIDPASDAHQALEVEIARQINTAFETNRRFNPFRFFVLATVDAFSLGLVYLHPVADAESIVHLLKRMVDAYVKQSEPGLGTPLNLYPPRFDNLLLRSPGLLVRKILGLPSLIRTLGRSCRAPYRDPRDTENGFVLFSLPTDSLSALTASAKSWDVTVNDLFLALLLKSVSFLAPDRLKAHRRRNISIGCIVNLRKDLALDSRRTFGLFLGSFLISHEVPDGISLRNLSAEVRQVTRGVKARKLYLATAVEMAVARLAAALSSTEFRKKIYQKNYPLWGGITNMNLNFLWDVTGPGKFRQTEPAGTFAPGGGEGRDEGGGRPLDYFRAVSTGPLTPLVLSITTANNRIKIGLSYRTTVFSRAQVDRMKATFLNSLDELARTT